MPPRRAMDTKVAKRVMNLKKVHWNDSTVEEKGNEFIGGLYVMALVYRPDEQYKSIFREVPKYSEDMTAAWKVVEELFRDSWSVSIEGSERIDTIPFAGGYDVTFSCKCGARGRISADHDSLPMAICLAALKVVEEYGTLES